MITMVPHQNRNETDWLHAIMQLWSRHVFLGFFFFCCRGLRGLFSGRFVLSVGGTGFDSNDFVLIGCLV